MEQNGLQIRNQRTHISLEHYMGVDIGGGRGALAPPPRFVRLYRGFIGVA